MAQQTYGEWMRSNPPIPNLTAVEWLQDKLNNVKPTQFCSIETIKEWVKQAKQMEKEQIQKAIDDALNAYGIIKNK